MAQPPILSLTNVKLTLGAETLFRDVTLKVGARERWVLVGRNGSGKSTLLQIMAGLKEADGGEVFLQPGIRAAYLPQEPDLTAFATLRDYVLSGLHEDEQHLAYRADILLSAVKLDPDQATVGLSGGEARRAAVAYTLMPEPDLLLLDEPTNHMDIDTIAWLEEELRSSRAAIVMISHDRAFLRALSNGVFWLDRGQVQRLEKGFEHFDAWAEQLAAEESERLRKLDKLIKEETVWSVQGISARRTRNQGRLRRLYALRDERRQVVQNQGLVSTRADSGEASGKRVIEAKNISKAYGDRVLIKDFSLRVMRGDRVGIIGPNGAGKSTLVKMLIGELEPDSGTITRGTNLTPTVIDQRRSALQPDRSIWDSLADMGGDQILVRGQPRHVVSYMRDFLFSEAQARAPVGALSGGERNRLLLAKALASPTNLLVLDEPTNDLDMETLDLLQEVLSDYDGTLILVSHDRDFVDRIVTSTILLDGQGGAQEYPGGYSDAIHLRGLSQGQEKAAKGTKTGDKTAKKAAEKSGGSAASSAKPKPTKKLTYAEQIRLNKLPDMIEAKTDEIAELEAALSAPDLYTKQPDKFGQITKDLDAARAALEALEEDWLALEEKREGA